MAAGTKECLYLLVLNFGSLKRDLMATSEIQPVEDDNYLTG